MEPIQNLLYNSFGFYGANTELIEVTCKAFEIELDETDVSDAYKNAKNYYDFADCLVKVMFKKAIDRVLDFYEDNAYELKNLFTYDNSSIRFEGKRVYSLNEAFERVDIYLM